MMRNKKLALATSTIVGMSAVAYQGARAGTASTSATANLVQDIVVSALMPMQFGDLLATGTATVTVSAAGKITAGAGVTSVGGTTQAAKFKLSTASTAETDQTITISAAALSESGAGTATLPWRQLNADYTGTKTASVAQTMGTKLTATIGGASVPTAGVTMTVYGGIEVQSSDPAGTYTGKITVTANRS